MSASKFSSKIRVCVLYGGRSGEHEVSLQSAASVIKYLDKNKFTVIPIAIDKKGQWFLNDLDQLTLNESVLVKTSTSKLLSAPSVLKSTCDVVFPLLHGSFGEDGTIQGLLEVLDVPYVGGNVLSSALGMDKEFSKRLVAANNVPVVPFITFNQGQWLNNPKFYLEKIKKEIRYPLFVKPANAGSSLGITKVKKPDDLPEAIKLAFSYAIKILVEQALDVREIEVAVLEDLAFGNEPLVSMLGEIIPSHEFYSYEAKYLDVKGAEFTIPAVLQEGQSNEIKALAAKVFVSLAGEGLARIDFFIEKSSGKIYFNELNTIPGFTKISMYPKLWQASGRSYQQLLTHLIELAIIRYKRTSKLKLSS